jgi:hypothetical protein
MRRVLLSIAFLGLAIGSTGILIACSGDESNGGSDDEVKASKQGIEGAACDAQKTCKAGLVCKAKSNGPPPGALGMPVHTASAPPGALGMPIPPSNTTCQKPDPGEEGAVCTRSSDCNDGFECDIKSSGSGSSTGGPPPGVLGMPILPTGTCKKSNGSSSSTGGPPPGALGMPIHN